MEGTTSSNTRVSRPVRSSAAQLLAIEVATPEIFRLFEAGIGFSVTSELKLSLKLLNSRMFGSGSILWRKVIEATSFAGWSHRQGNRPIEACFAELRKTSNLDVGWDPRIEIGHITHPNDHRGGQPRKIYNIFIYIWVFGGWNQWCAMVSTALRSEALVPGPFDCWRLLQSKAWQKWSKESVCQKPWVAAYQMIFDVTVDCFNAQMKWNIDMRQKWQFPETSVRCWPCWRVEFTCPFPRPGRWGLGISGMAGIWWTAFGSK